MDPFWALVSLVLAVIAVSVLTNLGKHTGVHVWQSWDVALSAQAPDRLRHDAYAADLDDELGGFRRTLSLARAEVERGKLDEAAEEVRRAARHVVRHVPALHQRLEIWNDIMRSLSAVYPLPRMHVLTFHNWRLRGMAAGEGAVRLALDAAHRFALRVWVLLVGLRLVLRGFAGTARDADAAPDAAAVARAVHRLEELGHDLGTLHGASLEVHRALLVSLHTSHEAAARPQPGTRAS